MAKDFSEQWPAYPPGYEKPLPLVDVRVKLSVDKLFGLLYAAGSPFVAKSQEVRGNKDYEETPWESGAEALERFLQLPQPEQAARERPVLEPAEYKGRFRKTTCASIGMGMKFRTEEVQRCTEAQPGKVYEVEVCVATTATYGDKFRGVCRHRLTADGTSWSRWHAEFALVYTMPVNGLLKRAIEKGCAGGLAKNFAALVEVLGAFAEVKQAEEERAASAEAQVQPPDRDATPPGSKLVGVLDVGFVQMFEPIAARLVPVSAAVQGSQEHGRNLDISKTALFLAVLALLLAVQLTLDVVRMALSVTRVNAGLFQPPSSILGVLSSAAVLLLAQGIARRGVLLSSWLWLSPERMRRASGSLPREVDPDIPTNGVRYDGYNAALANASADIASAEEELRRTAAGAPRPGEASSDSLARQQLRSGVRGLQQLVASTWTAGRRAMANGALSPERAVSPQRMERMGSARGSSPLPNMPLSDGEEGGVMSDDALQRPRSSKRLRRNRRSEKPFNGKAGSGARPGSGDDSLEDHSRYVELSTMGQRPFSSTSQGSSQQQMPETGPVESEVFENERYLPFRGWGHEWPGHFLPTDRVGHWSLRGDRPSGAESMEFSHVAPALPEGWEWLEEDWHIDMGGHEEACVDDEGWYYAVDFNWFRHPPVPGSGRFRRVRDYVRRRRWVRTRVRCDDDLATTSALRRLVSLSAPPPLLPLAQLLGEAADLGGQDLVRAIASGSSRASPAAASAPQLPSFELRPASGRRSSADALTPRLVLGRASPGTVSVRLHVADSGTVAVALRVRQAEPPPASVPGAALRGGPAAGMAGIQGPATGVAPLPASAVRWRQGTSSEDAEAAGGALRHAEAPSEHQQQEEALVQWDSAEGPAAPRSSFAAPAQAPADEGPDNMPGTEHVTSSDQAEAHIAASLEASLSQDQSMPELAKALSTPLPPEAEDGDGAAEPARGGAQPAQEAGASAGTADEELPALACGKLVPGEPGKGSGNAEPHVQDAAAASSVTAAEACLSEDSSWTDVPHPAQAAAAEQAPVPETAESVGSMTGLMEDAAVPAAVEGKAQVPIGGSVRPSAALQDVMHRSVHYATPLSQPGPAAAPPQAAADPDASREGAAPVVEDQQEPRSPTGGTIARRLSAPLPGLLLPRSNSGAGLAGAGVREDPLHLGDLAKRSSRLAAMAGDQIMKGIAHAARQTGGMRDGAAPAQQPRDGSSPPEKAAADAEDQGTPAPAHRRPSLLAAREDGGMPGFLQTLKARGEQSLAAARNVLSPDRDAPGDAGGAASGSGSPDHGGLGPSVRGMFSDLRRKTLDRVGHGPPLGNLGKPEHGTHREGRNSGQQDAADAPKAMREADAQPSSPQEVQRARAELHLPDREATSSKQAEEEASMLKRKTD